MYAKELKEKLKKLPDNAVVYFCTPQNPQRLYEVYVVRNVNSKMELDYKYNLEDEEKEGIIYPTVILD